MSKHAQCTVEGIVGLTGSGKTTFAIRKAFDWAAKTGQRVYTNIEFDLDGLRHHYLRRYGRRYKPAAAFHRLWNLLEDEQVSRFWEHVPPDSLIIIDEAQVYWPQAKQQKSEDPDLVRYLTQHRKLRHNVWWLTQFPTLLSHSWRKVNHLYWEVQNVRQRPLSFLVFDIRIPVDGFFYTCRYRDEKGERVSADTILAGLPWNRWGWDLFESRSLHGGLRNLRVADVEWVGPPVFRGELCKA